MEYLDLTTLPWTLTGHRPNALLFNPDFVVDCGPLPIRLPGSVQLALLDAGVIPDWRVGLNSRACEWVEHRDWRLTTTIPAGVIPRGAEAVLDAQGLDHRVHVVVDGTPVATLQGALRAHRVRLPGIDDGAAHRLALVIEAAPDEQGQWGFTSRSRHLEARYAYGWDWTARVVGRGVWDALTLRWGAEAALDVASVHVGVDEALHHGSVVAVVDADLGSASLDGCRLEARLLAPDGRVQAAASEPLTARTRVRLDVPGVELWWPNGLGAQPLSALELEVRDAGGRMRWRDRRLVGFRRIEWLPCAGAAPDAQPWVCTVNGVPVFLQGVNWTPARIPHHDATDADYARLVELYRDMGCTVLRIWGGGLVERDVLYDLCDRAGILLWQEMPLSSSGIENWPPDDPDVVADLVAVARSAIRRRAHHASLALWGGGNELMGQPDGAPTGSGRPIDGTQPALVALAEVFAREDPDRRFVATSPSGPNEQWSPERAGQGVHHDIHGPWQNAGSDADWEAMWAADDSLLRSEVGAPGASSLDVIVGHAEPGQLWPPTHPWWVHGQQDWRRWHLFGAQLAGLDEGDALRRYVELTQDEQARCLRVAASASRARFPGCAGFIVWMGHDCFPCPVNTSLIDAHHLPKPAWAALREVFRTPALLR